MLEFRDVNYSYAGSSEPALRNCSVRLPTGKRIAIIGRNGSGKSTLFLHCNGILKPQSGEILLDGEPISYSRKALKQLRQTVGIVFQQASNQLFSANVAQDISFGPLNLGLDQAEVRARIDEVAKLCQIEDLLDRPTHALSGGQQSRVALAGVLAMRPEVLLVDEPTATLDPPMRRQLFAIFDALHQSGTTLILATHEMEIAFRWADYVVVLDQGKVLLADSAEKVYQHETLLRDLDLFDPWHRIFNDPT